MRPRTLGLAVLLAWPLAAFAHPGGVDAQGCHREAGTGERHCHEKKRQESFEGKAVRVFDGDTVEVLRAGRPVRLRLHGIDAPERYQDHSQESRRHLGGLVVGKTVRVTVKDKDKYGRLVAELTLDDGTNVNREMVGAGLAWWYRRYAPEDEALAKLEAEAKAAKRGLWKDPAPVQPELFRIQSKGKKREPVM